MASMGAWASNDMFSFPTTLKSSFLAGESFIFRFSRDEAVCIIYQELFYYDSDGGKRLHTFFDGVICVAISLLYEDAEFN
jgi:hypothetical protein